MTTKLTPVEHQFQKTMSRMRYYTYRTPHGRLVTNILFEELAAFAAKVRLPMEVVTEDADQVSGLIRVSPVEPSADARS
jgi:hypothetical protein